MAFTNIPNGNLQIGAPLRSVDILALRDNIPAVMNGDTGAPRIKAAAFEGQSGSAPVFAARAWVNFDGELPGNIPPRASGNVSSVVRVATGRYTITFAIPMQDANYSAQALAGTPGNRRSHTSIAQTSGAVTATSITIETLDTFGSNLAQNTSQIHVAVFR